MNHKIAFIGRDQELKRLENLSNKRGASFVVVRGRRRIGKSRFVQEFGKNKGLLKFSGLAPNKKMTAQDQREHFANQLTIQLSIAKPDSADWYNLLLALAQNIKKENTVILLDEISWMAQNDPTFLPKLKEIWDSEFNDRSNLILIVCCSISSWIEKNIMSSTGFFGRICELITLSELPIQDSLKLLDSVKFKGSHLEKFILLTVSGGVPWYIILLGSTINLNNNISNLCFHEDGILVTEYKRVFHDLFGKRSEVYSQIVHFLANGPQENNAIAKGINYSRSGLLSEYLDDLVLSGFLAKDITWSFKTGLNRKIFRYRLKDNYLRFFIKVIEPNLGKIQRGHFVNQSYTNMPNFNSTTGLQFENLVLNNREHIYKSLGIQRQNIIADNPYFQRGTKKITGCQIDLLIQTNLKHFYLCEIKFSQKTIGTKVIKEVSDKLQAIELPGGFAISPVLIHYGELSDQLEDADFFIQTIDTRNWIS